MQCPNCHKQNPSDAIFCMFCGARLLPPGLPGQEAERRQMTVMFCDLVDSTGLSLRLDPEDLLEIYDEYQRACVTVVRPFEGHLAQVRGDGIMVCFSYPQAHEDDPYRAASSGLGIVEGVVQLSARLQRERDILLNVRIGIHTGEVVVGNITPEGKLQVDAVVGSTPNIAFRLQELAPHDSMVISSATYRLIEGYFDCQDIGFKPVRGIDKPMAIYQVLHESTARSRFDVAAARGLSPLSGRDADLAMLEEQWQQASEGQGRVALVSGEPGIGKSRLIWELENIVAQDKRDALVQLRCSAYHQNTAFFPLVDLLERDLLKFVPDEPADRKLEKIESYLTRYGFALPETVPLLANLLSVPLHEPYAPSSLPPEQQKQTLLEALVRVALLRAEQQPLLCVVEDLHWIDPSTLDFLSLLIDRVPSGRLLLVLSFRPEFIPPWIDRPQVTPVPLGRLAPDASTAIVSAVADHKELPPPVLGQVLEKSEGVPLFVEELTKFVLGSGSLREAGGKLELTQPLMPVDIPATLADLLTARLDRLGTAKTVAQLGATIGRDFSYELLDAVVNALSPIAEVSLRQDLARLVTTDLLLVTGEAPHESYRFKHALIQDAAYGSLLHRTRDRYHAQIARVLAEPGGRFAAIVEAEPELLAHHYLEAGLAAESIPYWLMAGQRALGSSANLEAIAHLNRGLDALKTLPEGRERMSQELAFHLALGPAYMATRGFAAAEVEACYRRAQELYQQLGNPPELAPVLHIHGLWAYHITAAHHPAALELAQQVLRIGEAARDTNLLLYGNMDVGWSHFFSGRPREAREHLERALALYDHPRHQSLAVTFGNNAGTSVGGCLAQTLWLLGYPEQATRVSEEQLTLLGQLTHRFSVAFGLDLTGFLRQYLGDPSACRKVAQEAIERSNEPGAQFALIAAMGTILRGWAITRVGQIDEGIEQMRQGLAAHLATGAALIIPYSHWLLAQAYGETGRHDEGLALLADAEAAIERSDERYWEAEIHRLRGDLLARAVSAGASPDQSPEACYRKALDVTRRQGAKSLELRAAMSLARLWQQEGRLVEARELLAATYGWFTEGLATPDLQAARALLAELESPAAVAS